MVVGVETLESRVPEVSRQVTVDPPDTTNRVLVTVGGGASWVLPFVSEVSLK